MAEVASAYVTLIPSAKGFASKAEGEIAPGMARAGSTAGDQASKSFGSRFKSGVKTAAKAGALALVAAGAAAIKFGGDAIEEAREAQKVGALTEATIKATGGAAKVTAKQVGDLAGALSSKTGIDDEVIQSGQNMLLTFKNIRNESGKGNDIFNQSTAALIDMSAAMGTEPKQAAIQLGKALNDPVKGVTALSRVGIQFTDQQRAQIKAMVDSGKTMGAQKIILKELESQFGGAAEAQATAGEKAQVAWGNFMEQVGTALLPMVDKIANFFTTKIVPALSSFVSGMQDGTGAGGKFVSVLTTTRDVLASVAGFVKRNADVIVPLVGALGAAVVVIKVISTVTKAWAAAQALLNLAMTANPIGIIVVAVAALVAGLVIAYKRSETFRNIVDGALRVVGETGKWLWSKALKPAFDGIVAGIKAMGKVGMWLWNNVFQPVFKFIVKGVAGILEMWAKMLRTLAKVPGFGWADKAADAMQGAANKANGLADNIRKIPASKNVRISVDVPNLAAVADRLDWIARPREARITIAQVYAKSGRQASGGLQARAHGGPVTAGQTYLVGEKGPELWTAHRSGTIIPNDKLRTGGADTHITVYDKSGDPVRTAQETARRLSFAGAI